MGAFRITRRRFLLGGAATLALAGSGYYVSRRPMKMALIGAGLRGKALAASLAQLYWLPGRSPEVVAICDVDSTHAEEVRNLHWPKAELYGDYRKVIERDDIKAVVIATPDHWHALIAYHALKAGKHVYCEKPLGLTIAEGQLLVKTVKETGLVFQSGTQQRSDWKFRTAAELVRNDRLGTLRKIHITLPQRWKGKEPGPFAPSTPPKELDFNQWLGQAPQVEYCSERVHGLFRRWYEYAGGTMTDWGAHHMDIAHWAMDMDGSGPHTIEGKAELPNIPNGFNTPVIFDVSLHFANGVTVQAKTDDDEALNGITFEGDKGKVFVSRSKVEGPAVDELKNRPLGKDAVRLHDSDGYKKNVLSYHFLQFFDCIDDGAQPISAVGGQHRSTTSCHLANIAMRLGRKLQWDAVHEVFVNDSEANGMISRPQRAPYQLPAA